MTPTKKQYFYAQNWPARIWFAIVPALLAITLGRRLDFDWSLSLRSAGLAALLWALGWSVALLTGWFVLGPIYYGRGQLNGAPYKIGDRVHILVGEHRDRVLTVYEVWESRDQVRVDLGEDAKRATKDVYAYSEICRAG